MSVCRGVCFVVLSLVTEHYAPVGSVCCLRLTPYVSVYVRYIRLTPYHWLCSVTLSARLAYTLLNCYRAISFSTSFPGPFWPVVSCCVLLYFNVFH